MPEFTNENAIAPAQADSFKLDWLTGLLLAVLAVFIAAAFAPAVKASFVDLDDQLYVFENPNVLNGLSLHSIKWALTTRTGERYMPMAWLSLQLDATISGLLNRDEEGTQVLPDQLPDAVVYHVTNIVLHALAAWILFLFLYRATRQRWASFAVVLLWAVHPLRAESVVWVTERKDEVAGMFGFLAMYLYVAGCEKASRAGGWWFWAACAALVLSLWAKAMFVTMPLLLLIVDYWPLRRIRSAGDFRRAVIEKWPMWVIVVLSAIGTAYVGRSSNGALAISQMAKVENAFLSYIRYLLMHVNFKSLVPYYPYVDSPPLPACGAVAVLTAVTGVVIWQRKRWPWLFAGWFWYLIAFLPMIGFVQSYTQAYGDRFSYLPSLGLIFLLVFALFQWHRGTVAIVAGAFGVAIILTASTFVQSKYWHDSITLFERTRDLTPPNTVVEHALGAAYIRAGRLEDAEGAYRKALNISPTFLSGHIGLAAVYVRMRRPEQALAEAQAAVQIAPNQVEVCKIYGSALFLSKRYDESALQFEKALNIVPNDAEIQQELQIARDNAAAVRQ